MMWKILGIEKTKDEELIKKAYREKLRYVNPEDDEEGFKELRRAYEEALEYASMDDSLHNAGEVEYQGRRNEVDEWLDRVDIIYRDADARRNVQKWEAILHDSICDDLDTELEAGEKLLVYFMSHSYLPQDVWQVVDKRFDYMENYEQLKEKFPENYLEYVKWQIQNQGFINYDLFYGKTDAHVDEYINKLYEVKNLSEDKELKKLRKALNELSRFDIKHPYGDVEEARYHLLRAEQIGKSDSPENAEEPLLTETQKQEKEKSLKEALTIMEDLDFEYSDNPYVERTYAEALIANGEIEKAEKIYDDALEKSEKDYTAMLGKANCTFLKGNLEEAKEKVEDILEDRVQDTESLELLEKINRILVKDYESCLEEELEKETCYKLGWCYYQQKEFAKGIKLLERLGELEEYDYVNLRCRLYLANEEYEKAYPLAKKWLSMIEEAVDDGSKEMKKRKNRLSLAHFSIGVCTWEIQCKKGKKDTGNNTGLEDTVYYIGKAIEEENNTLVKLSYMEQLARFYLESECYEECIVLCNQIIEKDKGFFPAYVHRQKANYELKNAKEVIDDYFACIEIYPAFAPPYILAAEVFFAFDQYDDVENVIEAAENAGLESDSLELYRIRCVHYKDFSREHVQEALTAIERLRKKIELQKDETDIEDLAELEKEFAILHWDLDETDIALGIVDDYLKEHPDSTTMLHLKVDILNRDKYYHKAIEVCKQIVRIEPDNLFSLNKLAGCYERLEDIDEAIIYYKKVLSINEEYAPALRRLMYIYSFLSNRDNDLDECRQGIEYATKLIEITGSAEGYVERGNLYIDLYELEKAVADCKKAIELDPEAYYAYNNLGCALLKLRRVNEAVEPLKQAVIMDPNRDHLPYLNLAECYILQQSYGKAIEAYNEVLRLRPKAVHLKDEIAKIYVMQKEYHKAIKIYNEQEEAIKKAVQEKGVKERVIHGLGIGMTEERYQLLEIYCKIADVYRQAGEQDKAVLYYSKVYSQFGPFHKMISLSAMGKAAEYYRDQGDLEKAIWYVETGIKNVSEGERNTRDFYHLYFVYATILFEQNKMKQAARYAKEFLNNLLQRHGGQENMLADCRYRPMYLYDLGIMNICAGDFEKGRVFLEQIRDCHLCVACETCDCFEYYFGMGLIAEKEDRIEEAKELFKKAIAIKGDYPCAKRHLQKLSQKI